MFRPLVLPKERPQKTFETAAADKLPAYESRNQAYIFGLTCSCDDFELTSVKPREHPFAPTERMRGQIKTIASTPGTTFQATGKQQVSFCKRLIDVLQLELTCSR